MPRKAFQLQVELEVQAVTCPGVWLCPNGRVSLQIYMLDSCVQTSSLPPTFPLLSHETFIFYKTFYAAQRLSDLQRLLNKEFLYAELIQWQNCDVGNVLASFETSLGELLYPTIKDGAIAGVDIDLLMEPAKHFPGIIAPKIEVCTKTTIEEKFCRDGSKLSNAFVVNPKVIVSKGGERTNVQRQRKVCHSTGYHQKKHYRKRRNQKPPFLVKKVDDDLLNRKPQGLERSTVLCNCSRSKSLGRLKYESPLSSPKKTESGDTKRFNLLSRQRINSSSDSPNKVCVCTCGHRHTQQNCPICAKYKYYFDPSSYSPNKTQKVSPKDKVMKLCPKTPGKYCLCLNCEEQERNRQEQNVCMCMGSPHYGKKVCKCGPQKSKSLASKLHERLSKTLRSCSECSSDFNSGNARDLVNPFDQYECQCGNMSSNDVLENFDKFYKSLYKNVSCKSAENKYVTSCC